MKKIALLTAGLLALNLTPSWGQPDGTPPVIPVGAGTYSPGRPAPVMAPSLPAPPASSMSPEARVLAIQAQRAAYQSTAPQPQLTRFNLDFPGGTPGELAKAIEKATGKPLNVIINKEDADTQLPPLQMNDVDVPGLFQALEDASKKTQASSSYSYGTFTSSFGFKTGGLVTDSSIWSFRVNKLIAPIVEKKCQFYSLTDYLNRGFTVDDITTAIQAGWKLAGETNPTELNYHKETQLLMACGTAEKLKSIQQVLDSLPRASASATDYRLSEAINQNIELREQVESQKKQITQLEQNQASQPVTVRMKLDPIQPPASTNN